MRTPRYTSVLAASLDKLPAGACITRSNYHNDVDQPGWLVTVPGLCRVWAPTVVRAVWYALKVYRKHASGVYLRKKLDAAKS